MKELIYEMNPWWTEKYSFIGIKRNKYLKIFDKNFKNKDIILVTGLRRVGKSTLLKQFIYNIINEKGIDPKRICYLSLDAYLFRDYSILDLVREFRKINELKINDMIYLFLDEVASKEDFSQQLKNLYDLGNSKIYSSSSSATLLKDKKGYLTGRSRTLEIEPLDFQEFMLFNKFEAKLSEKYLIEKYFKKYMEIGGMPEYVLTRDSAYITNLVDNILYKDIIGVHGIRNVEVIKELFKLLCERVGKQVSYNKLSKILGISKDSVKTYIGHFIDSYIFYIIEKDAKSLNERIVDSKKIYCADVGIKNVTVGFRDLGSIYENLVFLKIKKNKPRYVKIKETELDFKYKDYLIEAKYGKDMNKKQKLLFDNIKSKNKIIANGVDFFI